MKVENQVFIQGHTSLKFGILGDKSWPYDFFSVFLCRHFKFEWGSPHSTAIKWRLIKWARGEIAGKWGRRVMRDYSTASEIFGLPSSKTGKLVYGSSFHYCKAEKCCRQPCRPKLSLYGVVRRKKTILLITVLWDDLSQTHAKSDF